MPTRSRVRLRKAIQGELRELELPQGRGPWTQERLDSLRIEVARRGCERIASGWHQVEAASEDGIFVRLGGKLYQAPGSDDVIAVREVMSGLAEKERYQRHRTTMDSVFADGPIIVKRLVREYGEIYKLVTIRCGEP